MTFRTLTLDGARRVDAGNKAASNKHVQKLVDDVVAAAIQKAKVQTLLEPPAARWKTGRLLAEENIPAGHFVRLSLKGMKLAQDTTEVIGLCVDKVEAGEVGLVVVNGEVEVSSWDVRIDVGGHVGCGPGGWIKAARSDGPQLGTVTRLEEKFGGWAMTFEFRAVGR